MLILGDGVIQWVSIMLGFPLQEKAVGIGWMRHGEPQIGIVFYDYSPENMFIHVAMKPKAYWSPVFCMALMDYAFTQARVGRLTGMFPSRNTAALKFALKAGAHFEGRLRQAAPGGDDYLIYGLLREEAEKWRTPAFQRKLGQYNLQRQYDSMEVHNGSAKTP